MSVLNYYLTTYKLFPLQDDVDISTEGISDILKNGVDIIKALFNKIKNFIVNIANKIISAIKIFFDFLFKRKSKDKQRLTLLSQKDRKLLIKAAILSDRSGIPIKQIIANEKGIQLKDKTVSKSYFCF